MGGWGIAKRCPRKHSLWGTASLCPSHPFDFFNTLLASYSGSLPVKQIVAIVRPFMAEKVLDELTRAPLEACGVREVKGYGRQKSYLDEYQGSEYSLAFIPKVEITLWVEDDRAEEVVRKIVETARTGRMGDGKIFVLPSGIPMIGE